MDWRDECRKVRGRIQKADRDYFFIKPVMECELPDEVKRRYKLAISKPMDLRTIEENIDKDPLYTSQRFEEDMNLMFSNCFLFNTVGEYAYTEGKRLKKLFDTAWKTAKERINKGVEKTPGSTRRRAPSSTVSSPQSRRSAKRGTRTPGSRGVKRASTTASKTSGKKTSEGVPLSSGASSSSSSSAGAFPTLFPNDPTPVAAKPVDVSRVAKLTADWHRSIRVIYRAVKNHNDAYILESPVVEHPAVSLEEKKKYERTIKRPMDLRTVEENLELFPRPIDFHNDMMVIFSNCEEFNGEGPITEMARAVERHYLKQWTYHKNDVMESYNMALSLGYQPLVDLWEEWRHESPRLDLETGKVIWVKKSHHGTPPQLWEVTAPPKDFQKETLEFFPRISLPPPPPPPPAPPPPPPLDPPRGSPRQRNYHRRERATSGSRVGVRKHWRQLLGAVVKQLQDIPQGCHFLKPVHKYTEIPIDNRKAYYRLIKRPIDLETISRNLDRYPSPKDFVEDLELMFQNCFTFNKPGDDVYIAGSQLRKIYRESYELMREQIEESYAVELEEGLASKPGDWNLPRFDPEPPKFEVTKGWWKDAEEGTLRKRPLEEETTTVKEEEGGTMRKRAKVEEEEKKGKKKGKKGEKEHKHKGGHKRGVGEGDDELDKAREKVVAKILMKEGKKKEEESSSVKKKNDKNVVMDNDKTTASEGSVKVSRKSKASVDGTEAKSAKGSKNKKGTKKSTTGSKGGRGKSRKSKKGELASPSPTPSEGATGSSPTISEKSPSSPLVRDEKTDVCASSERPSPSLDGKSSPSPTEGSPSPSASSSGDDLAPISSIVFDKNAEVEKKMQSIASSFHEAMEKSDKPAHGKKRKKRDSAGSSKPSRSPSPSPSGSEASPAASSLCSPSPSEDEKASSKTRRKSKKKHHHRHHHRHHEHSSKKRRLGSGDSPLPSELCSSPSEMAASPDVTESLASPPSPQLESALAKEASLSTEEVKDTTESPRPPLTLPIPSKRMQDHTTASRPATAEKASVLLSVDKQEALSPKHVTVGEGSSPAEEDLFGEPIASDAAAATPTDSITTSPETIGMDTVKGTSGVASPDEEATPTSGTKQANEEKKKSILDAFASPPSSKKTSKSRSLHKLKGSSKDTRHTHRASTSDVDGRSVSVGSVEGHDWRWYLSRIVSATRNTKDAVSGTRISYIFDKALFKYDLEEAVVKDYYTIIKEPMDFGVIRRRIPLYPNPDEFKKDMDQIFRNCLLYNKVGSDAYGMGVDVRKSYEEAWETNLEALTTAFDKSSDSINQKELVEEYKTNRVMPDLPLLEDDEIAKKSSEKPQRSENSRRRPTSSEKASSVIESKPPATKKGNSTKKSTAAIKKETSNSRVETKSDHATAQVGAVTSRASMKPSSGVTVGLGWIPEFSMDSDAMRKMESRQHSRQRRRRASFPGLSISNEPELVDISHLPSWLDRRGCGKSPDESKPSFTSEVDKIDLYSGPFCVMTIHRSGPV